MGTDSINKWYRLIGIIDEYFRAHESNSSEIAISLKDTNRSVYE